MGTFLRLQVYEMVGILLNELYESSLGRHVNATSRKSHRDRLLQKLRNSRVLYHKTKNPIEAKICMKISFHLL